jgi:AcrR family transcriptional regulator
MEHGHLVARYSRHHELPMKFAKRKARSKPDTKTSPAGRRLPVQQRSQQTVANIVDAARSLLRQMPLEDVTTNRIAAEAGLSIGGLYRFFPDKQTIIDRIAVYHVHMFRNLAEIKIIGPLLAEPQNFETFDPAFVLNSMIDAYVIYLQVHADFRAISFGHHISASTKEHEASPSTGLPALLKNFMLERLEIPNTPELDLKLRVVSEAGERLIAYAFEQPTDDERNRIVAEMKKMLAGYLFSGDAP